MNERKKIKIGYHASGYNEKRNFIGLDVPNCNYVKAFDLFKFYRHFYFKLKKKVHPQFDNLFRGSLIGSNYDVMHFWNSVSLSNKPWITTFEYYLPRGAHHYGVDAKENSYIQKVLGRLNHDSCKTLIATSAYALNAQKNYLADLTESFDSILNKVQVIHPSQNLILNDVSKKANSEKIKFAMVGGVFFHKGGREVLEVVGKFLDRGAPIELHIVSPLLYGDFASGSTEKDQAWAIDVINKYPQIIWSQSLSNSQVMDLLKSADVVLLPSYDETYGYSALECPACGCPVISTDGAALAELNNNKIGWLINVDKDRDRRSVPRSIEAKLNIKEAITSQLNDIIEEILAKPDLIKEKGQLAIEKIKLENNPRIVAEKLSAIYKNALN